MTATEKSVKEIYDEGILRFKRFWIYKIYT